MMHCPFIQNSNNNRHYNNNEKKKKKKKPCDTLAGFDETRVSVRIGFELTKIKNKNYNNNVSNQMKYEKTTHAIAADRREVITHTYLILLYEATMIRFNYVRSASPRPGRAKKTILFGFRLRLAIYYGEGGGTSESGEREREREKHTLVYIYNITLLYLGIRVVSKSRRGAYALLLHTVSPLITYSRCTLGFKSAPKRII